MKGKIIAAGVAMSALVSAVASAQELQTTQEMPSDTAEKKPFFDQKVAAPARAFELSVGTGYTQGLGMLSEGVGFPSVAGAGLGVDLVAAYRINPRWSIGLAGQYQELNAERGTGARGLSGTIAGQYHFRPDTRLDPWVELGAGYRALWETDLGNQGTVATHGLQVARLRVGADVRATPDIAVGPFIGADANVFLGQDGSAIDDPRLSTFIQAGVMGRFDIGGERTMSAGKPAFAGR